MENNCGYCSQSCGNDWCSTNTIPSSTQFLDAREEEYTNQFNKNWNKSDNYKQVVKYLEDRDNYFNQDVNITFMEYYGLDYKAATSNAYKEAYEVFVFEYNKMKEKKDGQV